MTRQQITLLLLTLLLAIKFIYLPWDEWATTTQNNAAQLNVFHKKQQQVIDNEQLISDKLKLLQQQYKAFSDKLPSIKAGGKANALWFSLVDSLKTKDIKVYNQKVEFEQYITDDIGYVAGSLFISGKAVEVMPAILALETKAPYVFFDQLKLIKSSGSRSENMVTQLYLGYWFSKSSEPRP